MGDTSNSPLWVVIGTAVLGLITALFVAVARFLPRLTRRTSGTAGPWAMSLLGRFSITGVRQWRNALILVVTGRVLSVKALPGHLADITTVREANMKQTASVRPLGRQEANAGAMRCGAALAGHSLARSASVLVFLVPTLPDILLGDNGPQIRPPRQQPEKTGPACGSPLGFRYLIPKHLRKVVNLTEADFRCLTLRVHGNCMSGQIT